MTDSVAAIVDAAAVVEAAAVVDAAAVVEAAPVVEAAAVVDPRAGTHPAPTFGRLSFRRAVFFLIHFLTIAVQSSLKISECSCSYIVVSNIHP
jgi:hypothetical protein